MKFLKYILFFSLLSSFSQNTKLDSLKLILNNKSIKDTAYVNILIKIAKRSYPNKNDNVVKLTNEIRVLSDSLNFTKGKAESYYLQGKVETIQLKLINAKQSVYKSYVIYKQLNDFLGMAKTLNQLGVIYYYRNEYDKALDNYYKSIEVNNKIDNHTILANSYINIGLIFFNKNDLDKSLGFYNKALEIHNKYDDIKNKDILLNNIGLIYFDKKEINKSLNIFNECLDIAKKNNNKYLMGFTYYNLGLIYGDKKDYKKAIDYFTKCLILGEEIKNNNEICFALNGLGNVYVMMEKFNLALKYLEKSEEIAEKHDLLEHQVVIDKLLSNIYEEKKQYNKSLIRYKKYKIYYDSLNKLKENYKIVELEKKYKFKKEELLVKENELKLTKKIDLANKKLEKTKRQVLYGLMILLFLFIVSGFGMYYSRIKRLSAEYQKVVLKHKLLRFQMKPHFIFNSLSVLQGIVLHKEYKKASKYISKFSRLLREILETSREDIINLETEIKIIENYIYLRNIGGNNSSCSYKITIDKKINSEITFIPPMIIQPIVENSFEHGFVELNKNYELSIDFKLHNNNNNNKLICTIIDDGEGFMDPEKETNKKSVSSSIIKERLELFSKKYKEKFDFKGVDRSVKGEKGFEVVIMLPYKLEKND